MIDMFNSIDAGSKDIDLKSLGLKAPSSTWTYLINDDPFENMLSTNLATSIALSTGFSFFWLWPFLVIIYLVRWFKIKKINCIDTLIQLYYSLNTIYQLFYSGN
jgi:preprotein translocase subunit SecA